MHDRSPSVAHLISTDGSAPARPFVPEQRSSAPDRRAGTGDRRASSRAQAYPRVSVIVPALNEARNLPHVLRRLPPVFEVVLVDGGSTDDTVAVARKHRPDVVVVQQTRRGKGNALACGFCASRGDILVMLDADGSADPAEIPRFVGALTTGADFAKGSRFASGAGSSDITLLRQLGNRALGGMVNVLYHTHYTDLCYGYNAFWRHCLDVLDLPPLEAPGGSGERLWGDGFEIETLINVRVAQAGLRIHEVPSFEYRRIFGDSNLNTLRDGRRVLHTIVREHRRRPRAGRGTDRRVVIDLRDRCDLHGESIPCCVRSVS